MLNQLTIWQLAGKLARREVSSRQAMQDCLDQIQRVDGRLHAFLSFDAADALAQADRADQALAAAPSARPLLGVPIAIKDVIAVQGQPLRCGSKILGNFISPYSATVIEKLQAAGAVVFGRLNMDEFAMGSSTENSAFGPTCNPWDLTRIPGGSSGGSAAAVVADECLAALGSDTGGSIRQPAALCGCIGLKPTYGRVSRYGLVAFASSLDQIGPLTKDARDAALLLRAISGPDPRDSTSVPQAVPDYAAVLNGDIQASANLARFDGVRYGARLDGADPIELYAKTRGAGFGPEVKRRIILGTYALSSGYYDAYYLRAQKVRTLIRRDFLQAFEKVDAIATPTTPTAAFRLGEKSGDPLQMYLSDIFTISCNLGGICGLSLPCGFTSAPKLPIGLQLLGRPFGEETILRIAHAYEQSTGWHKEKPPLLP